MPNLPRPFSGRPLVTRGFQVEPASTDLTISRGSGDLGVARPGRWPVKNRIKRARIAGIGAEIDDAERIVVREHLVPGFSAIRGLEDSTVGRVRRLRQRKPQNSDSDGITAHDNDVRILRIDNHRLDKTDVLQAHVLPGFATVRRPVQSIAGRLLARPHVNHVGIRRSYGKSSNGSDSFAVEDRTPNLSAIGGLPDSASRCTEIVGIGMA